MYIQASPGRCRRMTEEREGVACKYIEVVNTLNMIECDYSILRYNNSSYDELGKVN